MGTGNDLFLIYIVALTHQLYKKKNDIRIKFARRAKRRERTHTMIELSNVKKSFGSNLLFDGLNLKIEKGEFVVFSGPSGCGKTTLLNMIGALEPFQSGSIRVAGMDITKRKNQLRYYSDIVGFIFQNFVLVEDKTVKRNLELVKPKSRTDISIEKALELVKLRDKLDSKVYTLSGGEQQRVALARLLVKKCELVLADEPTGSLDRRNAKLVMDILKILHKYGKTIILVTHDEEIKKAGDRIIEL